MMWASRPVRRLSEESGLRKRRRVSRRKRRLNLNILRNVGKKIEEVGNTYNISRLIFLSLRDTSNIIYDNKMQQNFNAPIHFNFQTRITWIRKRRRCGMTQKSWTNRVTLEYVLHFVMGYFVIRFCPNIHMLHCYTISWWHCIVVIAFCNTILF